MPSSTLELARKLIARPSVTPHDAGCQDIIVEHLEPLGFIAERLRFGEVDNLWLRRGRGRPLLVFAGHTDVVPPGPPELWDSPPFDPELRDGYLYGRGAADMKGSLAAMISACEAFAAAHPEHPGSFALLLTSDEEGPAKDGTARVVETLQGRGEKIDWCLVGEPSSHTRLGDVIKNGRRGSLSGRLRIYGQQGHVAYPHLADNPIHRTAPLIAELATLEWDQGNEYFPPTSFQISNIDAGNNAGNVIPGALTLQFNLRYSTELTPELLRQRIETLLRDHGLRFELNWTHSGEPFLTASGALVSACREAIREITGLEAELSTAGGTSDGRFIAPIGAQVVELGPVNASIHKINEHVLAADLETLSQIYIRVLERLLL
jgi:succinyl-diaminopimelate desuccinylase